MEEVMIAGAGSQPKKLVRIQAKPEPLEIDLQKTGIIIIDMQNAFVSKGGFFDLMGVDISRSQEIIEPIKEITSLARTKQIKVLYVAFRYSTDLREVGNLNQPYWYKEASSYREHPEWRNGYLIRGTWGADIVKELEPGEGDIIIEKTKYSAFFGTSIDTVLQGLNLKYLFFLGVATNICVEASIRDAYYHGYFPILVSDATAPLGPPHMHEATIFNIMQCYGWVTDKKELLRQINV